MEDLLEKKQKIRQFIIDTFLFGDTETELSDGDSLLDSGIVDSTGVLELVAFIEDEFNIEVRDEELIPENLDSLDQLAAFVERKM
jgi:acyl carrier protein